MKNLEDEPVMGLLFHQNQQPKVYYEQSSLKPSFAVDRNLIHVRAFRSRLIIKLVTSLRKLHLNYEMGHAGPGYLKYTTATRSMSLKTMYASCLPNLTHT